MPSHQFRICLAVILVALVSAFGSSILCAGEHAAPRPNILWITCEDISPNLRSYGDSYAVTPNLDRLAAESIRYANAFATAGVCAPSRSSLITGMYAHSLGTQHMRCRGHLPKDVKCFSAHLRSAGYYCTNNKKTDYNFLPPKDSWDESSDQAHWRHRRDGQPFFAVFNLTVTHESQIFQSDEKFRSATASLTEEQRHNPAQAPLPPYHPDTPETRRDWARYYDLITVMDQQVGQLLRQLKEDRLAGDTIVFFFSDHGAGMPRSKRWLYDTGIRVPLLVRIPTSYASLTAEKRIGTNDRLVSLLDCGPTVMSLCGVEIPRHLQGRPFLGEHAAQPRKYVYACRDRMDERYDLQRCVRDSRFKYIRNFRPDLPYFREQSLEYAMKMPSMRVWQRLADENQLVGPTATFMTRTKPIEELYDTASDPWETHNLAGDPSYRKTLEQSRTELTNWLLAVVDLGLLPEAILHERFDGASPYDAVRASSRSDVYPLADILHTTELATRADIAGESELIARLDHPESAIRYWAAVGLGILPGPNKDRRAALLRAGHDMKVSPVIRAAVADALCRSGEFDVALPLLIDCMKSENVWVRLIAANVLARIGSRAAPANAELRRGLTDELEYDYLQRACRYALQKIPARE